MENTKKRYTTLDGMRGIAAIVVVAHHYDMFFSHPGSGYLAVDFFFALSGYVLAQAYGERISEGMSTLAFLRIRFIRLYPFYFLGIFLKFFLVAFALLKGIQLAGFKTGKELLGCIFFNLFMLPNPFNWDALPKIMMFPMMGQAWSLFYELMVNGAYAATAKYLGRRKIMGIILVSAISLIFIISLAGSGNGGAYWTAASIWSGTSRVIFSFSVGAFIAMFPVRKIPAFPPWALLMLLAIFLYFSPPKDLRCLYDMAFILLLSPALLILGSANFTKNPTVEHSFILLGTASYPVYVLHSAFFSGLQQIYKIGFFRSPSTFHPVAGCVSMLLLIAMSVWLDRHYDRPVRDWLAARLR